MLLFFNPPQSLIQYQIVDPAGAERKKSALKQRILRHKLNVEQLEEQIAAQILKERLAKKAPKKASLKTQVERKLDEGTPRPAILEAVDSEALRLKVEGIIAEYQAKLEAEVQARIKKKRARALKILMLFATMDD